MESRIKYGLAWKNEDDLSIELYFISKGGYAIIDNRRFGQGLFHHMMEARGYLWPKRYRHRWTDLIYKNVLENIVTVLMGPGSSQKTSHASEIALIRYWARPHDSLCLVSTTTNEKLDAAIFGEMKMLHRDAQEIYPWLAGKIIDSKKAISTDLIDEVESRDVRKGILCRACYVGRQYVGLGVYAGIKQAQITFIADELQFMAPTFFDCLPNMFQSVDLDDDNQPDIKVMGSGNPRHDPYDQLSIAAEPVEGWESVKDVVKTSVWKTKFHRGVCVNLIGTDSPNFDVPEGTRPPYRRLINRETCKLVEARWKPGTLQHNSQVVGKMIMGMCGNRVITKQICEEHGAFTKAIWNDNNRTKIWFLDPAWGGDHADRCVWGWLEFGTEIGGSQQIVRFGEYLIVPIMGQGVSPDDQIARFCMDQCNARGIPLGNGFYDSTGRGTVGAAFARIFGATVPTPVAFGDRPTRRPVRHDLYIIDSVTQEKRLKRCDEEYGKYVTELWFAVRNIVECDQMRELPEDVMHEGCMREYSDVAAGKIDVETKEEMRERIGYSPDLFDAFVVGCEGARQLGFKIQRLGGEIIEESSDDYFDTEAKQYREAIESGLLKHT